jgi:hypothetical protein
VELHALPQFRLPHGRRNQIERRRQPRNEIPVVVDPHEVVINHSLRPHVDQHLVVVRVPRPDEIAGRQVNDVPGASAASAARALRGASAKGHEASGATHSAEETSPTKNYSAAVIHAALLR